MAYYLTIRDSKDWRTLNISHMKEFEKLSNYQDGVYTLEEIDRFTTKFKDESELKIALFEAGQLFHNEMGKKISIRFKQNNKLEKVQYGLIYQEQSPYLDILYLRGVILSKQNDDAFLKKLIKHCQGNPFNGENITLIMDIILAKNDYRNKLGLFLHKLISVELYRWDKKTKRWVLKYKSLHDLIMLVDNYIKNKNLEEQPNKLNNENTNSKTRKRVRFPTKTEIPNQLTFEELF